MSVRVAETDAEIDACYAVMRQLRPHLDREGFRRRVRTQQRAGYRLAWLATEGRPVAVAGYRLQENLASGRHLFVDDLVAEASARSRGHGARLLGWLLERARAEGCTCVRLASGTWRTDAHRFYEREGFALVSYEFEREVQGGGG